MREAGVSEEIIMMNYITTFAIGLATLAQVVSGQIVDQSGGPGTTSQTFFFISTLRPSRNTLGGLHTANDYTSCSG